MTCEECIAELATGSLRDLAPDSPVMSHCARCPDCAQLTTLLRDREYQAASVLNNLPPVSNPVSVAETAGRLSHRRRVGGLVVMASGTALVLTIWIAAATTVIPKMNSAEADARNVLRTETIPLTCLSPQQAADIINPYVRGHGSKYWVPSSGISAITVQGNASELARSRDLIREFEQDPAAECRQTPAQKMKQLQQMIDAMHGDDGSSPVVAGSGGPPTTGIPGGVPPAPNKK
jgi:hypothetical protein